MTLKMRIVVASSILFVFIIFFYLNFYQNNFKNQNQVEKTTPKIAQPNFKKNEGVGSNQNLLEIPLGDKTISYDGQKTTDKNQVVKETLISKSKVEIELTFYDSFHKLLVDYEVELHYWFYFDKKEAQKIKFNTDRNGNYCFSIKKSGELVVVLKTKDYQEKYQTIVLYFGQNKIDIIFEKGGQLEIQLPNNQGNIYENLKAKSQDINGRWYTDYIPCIFIKSQGVYILPNLPIGHQKIFFKANGFQLSNGYEFYLSANNCSYLELALEPIRKINLNLEIKNKPDSIRICLLKERQKIPPEILNKNENGLYEVEIQEHNINRMILLVESYLPIFLDINPNQDNYNIILEKGYAGIINVVDEKGVGIPDAEISFDNFLSGNPLTRFPIKTDKNGKAIYSSMREMMFFSFTVNHNDYIEETKFFRYDVEEETSITVVLKKSKSISGKILFNEVPVQDARSRRWSRKWTGPCCR